MDDELARWAAGRAGDLIARAEAEAVAELKGALLAAVREGERAPRARPEPVRPPAPAPAPPPAPSGHGLWAYCVARDGDSLVDGGPGVDGEHPVTWIRGGGLAVLCSRVPLAEFGEEPLRRNLNDIVWLERIARSHETAIELALEQGTIVPLRLCTIFASEAGAREMLAGQREPLEVALDALEGRVEWSVKLLVDRAQLEAGLSESSTDTDEQAGTGAAYLLRRREERRSREASDLALGELAEDVHARLQDWADDARVRPAQNPELSGHAGEMVLNGAYLVDRSRSAELRELVAELEQRHRPSGARLELAGPFPPYSFVPEATE